MLTVAILFLAVTPVLIELAAHLEFKHRDI